jgi:DNA invertase Pin-like site-specific DNA recombinase
MSERGLRCIKCDAVVEATADLCACGEPFLPLKAEERAKLVMNDHPDWSLRQIAREAKVGRMTVQRARMARDGVPNGTSPKSQKRPISEELIAAVRRILDREPDASAKILLIDALIAALNAIRFECFGETVRTESHEKKAKTGAERMRALRARRKAEPQAPPPAC